MPTSTVLVCLLWSASATLAYSYYDWDIVTYSTADTTTPYYDEDADNVTVTYFKCCDWHHKPQTGAGNRTCISREQNETFALPPIYRDAKTLSVFNTSQIIQNMKIGMPDCDSLFPLSGEDGPFYLMDNSSLLLINYGVAFNNSMFCLEEINGKVIPVACLGLLPYDYEQDDPTAIAVYPIGLVISLPFLAFTFCVYISIPELRNLHGWTLLSQVFSLFIGYSSLATVQFATSYMNAGVCVGLAYTIQFFFLAVFFWLNVMCFDIYWAFSGLRKLTGSAREREHKKFLYYSAYAWGGPLVILAFTLVMDFANILPIGSLYKPDMGKNKCFFDSKESTWLYFYGPMAVLIFSNLLMFATTARRIYVHTRETSVLKSKDSKRHDKNDKERFHLYWKLFIVMGINWVMELVSWMVRGPHEIWYLTDITNTLQGVFIFIIFVCKRRIVRLLKARLCHDKSLGVGERGRSTKSSSGGTASTTATNSTAGVQPLSQTTLPPEDSLARLNGPYDSDAQI